MSFDEYEFENEVRRVARALWPSAEYQGASVEDGKERDGVFVTDECVHLIECTVSRKRDKAIDDAQKLSKLAKTMRNKHATKAIKCWFITLDEPTADQREVIKKHEGLISTMSLDQFRSRLIDVSNYIQCRKNHKFGSMEESESISNKFHFIELDILNNDGQKFSTEELSNTLMDGSSFILLGDYGAGKSTTMREIFMNLQRKFFQNKSNKFPVFLNLREHYGQVNADEALERHARKIGYGSPLHLVKAWRAGYAIVLLDGFDEIAIPGWSGQASRLKKLRYDSMQLVREFVRDTPKGCGLAISGRNNFFNSIPELETALGINVTERKFMFMNLNDFTADQLGMYLNKKGWSEAFPSWLPSRPLLVGYLARQNLLQDALSNNNLEVSPAEGWDNLLTQICNRESKIEFGVEGGTIRVLLERLASKARADFEGLGPIQVDDIMRTFQDVCGFAPDDRSIVILNRLPGLGSPRADDGARSFIDQSLADAAKGGDVFRYIESPHSFDEEICSDWQSTLRELGKQVVAHKCVKNGFSSNKIIAAIQHASTHFDAHALCADVVQVAQELDYSIPSSQYKLYVKSVFHLEYSVDSLVQEFSGIEYQGCVFQSANFSSSVEATLLPKFNNCSFGTLDGYVSEKDLPSNFTSCTFEEFLDSAQTSKAILSLNLPLRIRVLLVTLKKLFLQSGAGRRDSALYRGLDQTEKNLIPGLMRILKRERFVIETKSAGKILWIPVRNQSSRVRKIISAPNTSNDPLLALAEKI
ncbi:MAG: hypothetical protein HY867_05625 [Chloroflexi bacterium]|nr:hypothetical protein [Chloroflexota bacterium]